MTPFRVLQVLEEKFNFGIGSDGNFNSRQLPTLRELQNLQKTVQHELRPNRNDSLSLQHLVDGLKHGSPGVVLKYRPQVMDDGKITQHFMLVLSTSFRRSSPFQGLTKTSTLRLIVSDQLTCTSVFVPLPRFSSPLLFPIMSFIHCNASR